MASEKQIQSTIEKLMEAAKDKSLPGKFRSDIMGLISLLQGDSMPGFEGVIRDDDTTKEALKQADRYLKNLIPAERKKISTAPSPEAKEAASERAEAQSTTGARKLAGAGVMPVSGRSNRKKAGKPAEKPKKPEAKTEESPAAAPAVAEEKPAEKPGVKVIKPVKVEEVSGAAPAGSKAKTISEALAERRAAAAAASKPAPTSAPTDPPEPPLLLSTVSEPELATAIPSTSAAPKPTTAAPTAKGTAAALRKVRGKGRGGALALGALGGLLLASLLRKKQDTSQLEGDIAQAQRRSEGARVAELLEQARMERTVAQNQARLAQADPTLYTSVMAGRRVPTNSVVLGGRPRMDLMRELAASMDSGRFAQRDPLSELMG